jgi:hypothetical protein
MWSNFLLTIYSILPDITFYPLRCFLHLCRNHGICLRSLLFHCARNERAEFGWGFLGQFTENENLWKSIKFPKKVQSLFMNKKERRKHDLSTMIKWKKTSMASSTYEHGGDQQQQRWGEKQTQFWVI